MKGWRTPCRGLLLGAVLLLGAWSCRTRGRQDPPAERKSPPAEEVDADPLASAFATARPVLAAHCFRCHTSAGAEAKPKTLQHLSFDRYPPTGHHAQEVGGVIRRVLVGEPDRSKGPTMPADDPGSVAGEELKKVLAWADLLARAAPDAAPHPRPARP